MDSVYVAGDDTAQIDDDFYLENSGEGLVPLSGHVIYF